MKLLFGQQISLKDKFLFLHLLSGQDKLLTLGKCQISHHLCEDQTYNDVGDRSRVRSH